MKCTKAEREESIAQLREWLPKGSQVFLILRHVSKSGMARDISPIYFEGSNPASPRYPWFHIARVLGWRAVTGGHDAVRVQGAGMDMGFHLVYSLGQALYGDGYALHHRWL